MMSSELKKKHILTSAIIAICHRRTEKLTSRQSTPSRHSIIAESDSKVLISTQLADASACVPLAHPPIVNRTRDIVLASEIHECIHLREKR